MAVVQAGLEVPDIASEVVVKSKRRKLASKPAPTSSRSLRKKEKMVVAGAISRTDIIDLAGTVIQLVDSEQHLHYFPERVKIWEKLRFSDSFLPICECLRKLYNSIYTEFNTASDKYAKFQLKWYQQCSYLLRSNDEIFGHHSCLSEAADKWVEFKNINKEYSSFHLNCVMITIQSAIFKQLSKQVAEEISSLTCPATSTTERPEEPDDVYYRFGGAAIAEMLHKRYRSIHTSPYSRRSGIATEITILKAMECQDKSTIPTSLQYCDRGFMYFPDQIFIPFIKSVDNKVRSVANKDEIKKHGKNIIAVASEQVKEDSSLHEQFNKIMSKKFDCPDTECVHSVYIEFTRKLYNTRLAEFVDCYRQTKAAEKGSATLSGQNLRDSLLSQHTNLNALGIS